MKTTQTISLASKNPVKGRAALQGFERMFPGQAFTVEPISVPSGVADQPASDEETLTGARNRAQAARRLAPQSDFWVGIEGGIEDGAEDSENEMSAFAWVVILGRDQSQGQGEKEGEVTTSRARSASFFLPPAVVRLVRQGVELGEADDQIFLRSSSKTKGGAVGILTQGVVDRTALYEQAVVLALIPFLNRSLYGPEESGTEESGTEESGTEESGTEESGAEG